MPTASSYVNPGSEEVTLTCTGEGATSEGEFWECMNAACLEKLPLLVLVEDNAFAISVPVEHQTAGGSISALSAISRICSSLKSMEPTSLNRYQAMSEPLPRTAGRAEARRRSRPLYEPYSHSLSDDERLYKTPAERANEAARDP